MFTRIYGLEAGVHHEFWEAGVAFLGFGALVSLFGKSTDSSEAALAAARLRCMLKLNLGIPVLAVSLSFWGTGCY